MFRFTSPSVLFLAALLVIPAATAQTDVGRLLGSITDGTGAVIPGVTVKVTSEKTGQNRIATTNEQGYYIVPQLRPDTYSVEAETGGFSKAEYKNVGLSVGQERTLNIVLEPASVSTEVTITAGGLTTLDTDSARIGANVNAREVATLPLNGRQLSQLYMLTPGATTAGSGSYDNIRFNGRANQQNEIRFDGVEGTSILDASPGNLNGETSTGFRLQSSLENVQEFRVESSNYPAEFGTGTGGQISVVTKSGGNDFHGSLFEYLRNDAMDARNFFDGSVKSPLRLNQFGGSVGGPIIKDKFFFFGAYEGLRQRANINLIETVPSDLARSRAVPSIQPLLAGFPRGQQPSSNPLLDIARVSASAPLDENYGSLRFDYRINDRYSIYGRYFRDQGASQAPQNVTGNYFQVTSVPQNALVNFSQTLSPSLINETKFGLNGSKTRANGYAPPLPGVDVASGLLVDFSGNVAIPGVGGQGSTASAARIGNLIRSNSTQNGRGQPYTSYSLSFVDNLSWLHGNHNVKFGFEARPIRIYTDRQGGTTYTFSNIDDLLANRPGNVQFLGDLSGPSPFNGGVTGQRELRQSYWIGYAQDEWKIRPNLTMNYGLRYEYYTVIREVRNLAVMVDTTRGSFLPSDTPFYQSSPYNFGPRLAFTWSPDRFSNKTVFRIGAGYYYGPGQTEDQIQPIETDRPSRTLTNVPYPINVQETVAGYDINDPNLGFQPRVYPRDYRIPEKILSYTASVQQQLPGNSVLTVAYVGSQGRNLFLRSWVNRLVGVNMNPATGAGIPVLEFGNYFAQMDTKTSGGTDHYDSLQTTFNRRYSSGLTIGSQWTWSHSIGNTGGSNEAQTATDPLDFGRDRGNNAFDIRHSANVSALYDLPIGKGRRFMNGSRVLDTILGNWEIGGIYNFRTGVPIDVKISRPDIVYQMNSTGAIVNSPVVQNGQVMTTPIINVPLGGAFRNQRRPDYVAGVNPFLNTSDKRVILNPAAFSTPAPGTYGNLGRWALHGPNLAQFDLTFHKRFPIREAVNLEFRAEIYNILNRANLANPSASLNNALGTGTNQLQPGQAFTSASAGGSFGISNSTVERAVGLGAQRQVQLSLRLNF
jgi:hypothetical protein